MALPMCSHFSLYISDGLGSVHNLHPKCVKFLPKYTQNLKKRSFYQDNAQRCVLPVSFPVDLLQWNLDLRKIVGTTDFLVHKLFDLRKIF